MRSISCLSFSLSLLFLAPFSYPLVQVQILGQALADTNALVEWSRDPADDKVAFISAVEETGDQASIQILVPNPDATQGFLEVPFASTGRFHLVAYNIQQAPLQTSNSFLIQPDSVISPLSPNVTPSSSAAVHGVTLALPSSSPSSTASPSTAVNGPLITVTSTQIIMSSSPTISSSSSASSDASLIDPNSPKNATPIIVGVIIGLVFLMIVSGVLIYHFARWKARQRLAPSQVYQRETNNNTRSDLGTGGYTFSRMISRYMGRATEAQIHDEEAQSPSRGPYNVGVKADSFVIDPEVSIGSQTGIYVSDSKFREKIIPSPTQVQINREMVHKRQGSNRSNALRASTLKFLLEPPKLKWWKGDKRNPMRQQASILSLTTISSPPTDPLSRSNSSTTFGTVIHGRFDRIP